MPIGSLLAPPSFAGERRRFAPAARVLTCGFALALCGFGAVGCGEGAADGEQALAPAVAGDGTPTGAEGSRSAKDAPVRVPNLATRAERWTAQLGEFLSVGPVQGTWVVTTSTSAATWQIAPHPTDPELALMAQAAADPNPDPKLRPTEVVSRSAVPRLFFEAPAWLFFANYRLEGDSSLDPLPHDPSALRLSWRPVHTRETSTERRVWFSQKTGRLLSIQDRSRDGRVMRSVACLDAGAATLPVPESLQLSPCCGRQPELVTASDIRRATAAPYSIFEPAWLPAGFMRIRADYRVAPLGPTSGTQEVHRATLLYSDGLALLSVLIAPVPDMNAILSHYGKMPPRSDDPQPCPGLPEKTTEVRDVDRVVRMRTDVCRTLLSREDVEEGLSFVLMGRNELPLEDYVRAIAKLKRVEEIEKP